ncbi:PKD domain-containing protein [Bacillus sp. SCS-151]|uniref:PKD domain-containing protein n=1 Tax=Nanhaiella sioensis TaxID=3115293 RepID=UPI00397C5EF0
MSKKRKVMYKITSIILVFTVMLSTGSLTQANSINNDHASIVKGREEIKKSLQHAPGYSDLTFSDLSSVYEHNDVHNTVRSIKSNNIENNVISATSTVIDFAYLNNLSYDSLIDYLIYDLNSVDDIEDFWTFSSDAVDFYVDESRHQALLDAIVQQAPQWRETNDVGLINLIEMANRPFYKSDEYSELSFYDDLEYREKVNPAINAVLDNRNVGFSDTDEGNYLITQLSWFLNHAVTDSDMYYKFGDVVREFTSNLTLYADYDEAIDAYIEFIYSLDWQTKYNYGTTGWEFNAGLDYLIEQITRFIYEMEEDYRLVWALDNTMWLILHFNVGGYHSNEYYGYEAITEALDTVYNRWGAREYLALYHIYWQYDGIDANGTTVARVAPYDSFVDRYFGNEYVFEAGEFTIWAGDDVPEDKIKRMYWAAREVKSQFHRFSGTDDPADGPGNPDDNLLSIVYNSKFEYQLMNGLLNNDYSVENGGRYIESAGLFYTWDRSVAAGDSRFELEELFRHEYTHYLMSRFLIPGFYADTPLYDNNNNLPWFGEGGAEFFAGSTRTGVDGRNVMVEEIGDPASRFTVEQVINATYDLYGFDYYDYAYSFYDFMVNGNGGDYLYILNDLNEIVANEDFERASTLYRQYVDDLSQDNAVEAAYQQHMNEMWENYTNGEYRTVLVGDEYLYEHPERSIRQIQNDITSLMNLDNVEVTTKSSTFFETFTFEGTYVSESSSRGEAVDIAEMDNATNTALNELDNSGVWSGYKTVTAYFVNHRVNSNGQFEFDVVLHGIYAGETNNSVPIALINAPATVVVNESTLFTGGDSYDEDGSIVNYEWDFGDGNISSEENPIHIYEEAGSFVVTLSVTDNEGATGLTTKTIVVEGSDEEGTETEPNNRKSAANNIQVEGEINGSLDYATGDHTDWFYFDVEEAGDIVVNVTKTGGEINAIVEDENGNHIGEPLRNNTMTLSTGRYYVIAYTWSGESADYTISISHDNASTNTAPVAIINAPRSVVVNETVAFDGGDSYDEDGWITSYEWDFGDGNTSSVTNPTHVYEEVGSFDVQLTVTDDFGETSVTIMSITVNNDVLITETEPNNRKSNANFIEGSIVGSLDYEAGDHTDWYYFDMVNDGEVTINLNRSGGNYNVVVEDENGEIVAEPLRDNVFHLPMGTYYIIAYTWSGEEIVDYSIQITK